MPTMPNGLVPNVSSYSIGSPGGVMRTEVAGGAPRVGMMYDRGVQEYRVTLLLDALKFSVWTAFFHHIIKKGSVTFDMQLDSGFGTETHAVTMIPGSYSATRTGGIAMIATFNVEAESKAYDFSAEDAQSMIDYYNLVGGDSDDLLLQISQFANVDTLVLDEV